MTLLSDLCKSLNLNSETANTEQVLQAVESQSVKISGLEQQVQELTVSLEKVSSDDGEALSKLREKHSALQLEREGAARNLLKLQKEYDSHVASSKNDKEKEALHASVTLLEKKLREEVAGREKVVKSMQDEYSEQLRQTVKSAASDVHDSAEMKKREKAVASQEAALQYNQLRAADKEEEMLQLVVSVSVLYSLLFLSCQPSPPFL